MTDWAFGGKYLRVDLTTGTLTDQQFDHATLRSYVGGTGIGVKVLYEEVPRGAQWNDPENRFVMATGPLGGTAMGGSGTISVITKGPLTNGAATCQANGFMGAFLRLNGYDGIILQGAAPTLSYLYIHDGKAELRDAAFLAGADSWEMSERVAAELGVKDNQVSVFGIGPAGEVMSRFACFCGDRGHVAGHNGTGAVLGAKKLKCIAVQRARGTVPVFDAEGVSETARQIWERKQGTTHLTGTLTGVFTNARGYGVLPVKNYSTSVWEIDDKLLETWNAPYIQANFAPQRDSCWACRFVHCTKMTIPEGRHKGFVGEEPEYEQFAAFGPVIDNRDVNEAVYLSNLCDRLGFENNEMGWLMGFVMEAYEKGLLTKEQLGGIDMTWGNVEGVEQLMKMMARREGIGDLLAEGVKRVAESIGGEATQIAVHTMKGNTPRGHDHRVRWTEWLDTVTSDTGTMMAGPVMGAPDSLKVLGVNKLPETFSPEETSDSLAKVAGSMLFEDSLVTCRFNTRSDMPYLVKALNAATGWDMTVEEAMNVGRRAMNLLRAFNIQNGVGPELDRPSPRYGEVLPDGPSKGHTPMQYLEQMAQDYYAKIGWDERGVPKRETLEKLGLAQVADDLDLA